MKRSLFAVALVGTALVSFEAQAHFVLVAAVQLVAAAAALVSFVAQAALPFAVAAALVAASGSERAPRLTLR